VWLGEKKIFLNKKKSLKSCENARNWKNYFNCRDSSAKERKKLHQRFIDDLTTFWLFFFPAFLCMQKYVYAQE
jgi:hypothetical protein